MDDADQGSDEQQETRGQGKTIALLVGMVVVVAVLLTLGKQVAGYLPQFAEWVESLGVWGPVAFIVGYAVATVAFVPGSVLTLAAGGIFGLWKGTGLVLVGATLGATLAFLVSRYGARGWVETRIRGNQRFEAIDRAVGKDGFKVVTLLRLSPVFPFNLLNYALGLTQVRLGHYVAACLGMLPGTFLYVYYGFTAGSLAKAVSDGGSQRGTEFWIFVGAGLLATVIVTVFVTRRARRALEEAADV